MTFKDNMPARMTLNDLSYVRPCFVCTGTGHADLMLRFPKKKPVHERWAHTGCWLRAFPTQATTLGASHLARLRAGDLKLLTLAVREAALVKIKTPTLPVLP